jgi:hypothetical protein
MLCSHSKRVNRQTAWQLGSKRKSMKGEQLMLGTILLIILILLLLGAFSGSRRWGYFPSGGLGLVIVIVIILLLLGRI